MALCHFCWDGGPSTALSREHLISEPVARAFGINRSEAHVGRFDPNAVGAGDLSDLTWSTLATLQVRLACESCNNTWMNSLEHDMARVASWVGQHRKPLGATRARGLARWLLKTYIVLSVLEGGTRKFMSGKGFAVLPEVTRASQLRQDDPAALEGVAIGLARSQPSGFNYAFGNPTVIPSGPTHANARSAGVAVLTFDGLQVWIVVPMFRSATVRLPPKLTPLHPRLTAGRLQTVPSRPDTSAPVVDNGDHNWPEIEAALAAWAQQEAARTGRDVPPSDSTDSTRN